MSNDEPMAACMKAFVQGYSSTASAGVFSPKGLFGAVCKKAPRFRGFAQQDSEELLHVLLDTLQARRAPVVPRKTRTVSSRRAWNVA